MPQQIAPTQLEISLVNVKRAIMELDGLVNLLMIALPALVMYMQPAQQNPAQATPVPATQATLVTVTLVNGIAPKEMMTVPILNPNMVLVLPMVLASLSSLESCVFVRLVSWEMVSPVQTSTNVQLHQQLPNLVP